MIRKNFVKEKLSRGELVLGTWNTLGGPLVTEVLARSGLDFVIIDFEHGPYQLDNVHSYVNACKGYSCSPIVRIPTLQDWMVLQVLDQGGHGVLVPHIDNAQQAQSLVASAKYYPKGSRGFTPFTKAGGFSNLKSENYPQRANEDTLTSIIIESKEGLENIEEILAISDLDLVYFGAYDISQALGFPGQVKHGKVTRAIETAVEKVARAGKSPGGFVAQSREDLEWQIELGMRFITYNVDTDVLFRPLNEVVNWLEKRGRR